jgi:succinate dehydrogenase/fumarate reductase iron-sulfur protein
VPEVTIRVQRSAPQPGGQPRFEEHTAEVSDKASILDALFALQRGPCPDLAFRFSCRVGMCGSCAMVVNGRERLTCSTLVKTVGAHLRVEPLRNLPVTRDLAVDMEPFFAAYKRVRPQLVPRDDLDGKGFYCLPQSSKEWKALSPQPQCIDCGACYSACTLVTLHPRYLGPMALHRALNLIVDPRDKAHAERLRLVAGEAGAFRCHTLGNCRDVCPRGISPTHSIQRLKRLALLDQLSALFAWVGSGVKRAGGKAKPA